MIQKNISCWFNVSFSRGLSFYSWPIFGLGLRSVLIFSPFHSTVHTRERSSIDRTRTERKKQPNGRNKGNHLLITVYCHNISVRPFNSAWLSRPFLQICSNISPCGDRFIHRSYCSNALLCDLLYIFSRSERIQMHAWNSFLLWNINSFARPTHPFVHERDYSIEVVLRLVSHSAFRCPRWSLVSISLSSKSFAAATMLNPEPIFFGSHRNEFIRDNIATEYR